MAERENFIIENGDGKMRGKKATAESSIVSSLTFEYIYIKKQ